ncbi:MAG: hypothetical protein UY52_C0031G0003 [Parcubacteria group bacterium GW2011_GWC2_49_9]|nr:MAG: hypothetical protein UY52_C0031G0003 [Parcubacteria group bacterium GW2011_GWC2_49_9]
MKRLFVSMLMVMLSVPMVSVAAERMVENIEDVAYVPGEVIVKYRVTSRARSAIDMYSLAARHGAQAEEVASQAGIAKLSVDASTDMVAYAASLMNDSAVEYAEPNYQYHVAALTVDDVRASELWGMDKISAQEAWDFYDNASASSSAGEAVVAVIDTGVAYGHPDIAANMWNGTSCVNDANTALGSCLHGYDFEESDLNPFPNVDRDNANEGMHGTHVAGTIAAVRNNALGVAGVGSGVKIMALKSTLSTDQIVRAINFARYNGAQVINASFAGTGSSTAIYEAIRDFPGIFVAAAGNDTNNNDLTATYPCAYELANIICVAATNSSDGLASYSSYGAATVDIAAPGSSVLSTSPATTTPFTEDFGAVTTPNIPASWTQSGGTTWRTATTSSTGSTVYLYADTESPYSTSSDSTITLPRVDLTQNSAGSSMLSFGVRCETEITTTDWYDYLALYAATSSIFAQVYANQSIAANNGTTWNNASSSNPVVRFDEAQLDLGQGSEGLWGRGAFVQMSIPTSLHTASTTFQFRWITNATDNNYHGCRVSNMTVTTFTDAENYQSISGTSMATPHVAGLAGLLMSYNPSLSTTTVKNTILTTGSTLGALSGKTLTSMQINAAEAIQSVSYEKSVLSFAFNEASTTATTTIDHTAKTIAVELPYGTSLVTLTPSYTISSRAIADLATTSASFVSSTNIVVTAADTSTTTYILTATTTATATVTVTVTAPSSGGGGGGSASGSSGGGGGGGGSSAAAKAITTAPALATSSRVALPVVPLSSAFTFTQNLELGAQGSEVVELQKRLVAEGFLVMPASVAYGYFGNATKIALIAFQQKHALTPAVGYVGTLTRAVLNNARVAGATTPVETTLADSTRQELIRTLQAQLAVLIAELAKLLAAR